MGQWRGIHRGRAAGGAQAFTIRVLPAVGDRFKHAPSLADPMRVFITGGTGFVGPAVVRAVRDAGHDVTLLVHKSRGPFSESDPGITFVEGDVTDPQSLAVAIPGHDAVIHLVAIRRAFPAKGITFERMHTEAARNVVEASKEARVTRFLLMSASGVEMDQTGYQRTKLEEEALVKASGIPWTIFRPTFVTGEGEAGVQGFDQEFADVVRKAPILPSFGGGDFTLQPVARRDVAVAFARALTEEKAIGKTYFLAGPDRLTWNEYLRKVSDLIGVKRVLAPVPLGLVLPVAKALERFPRFPASRDELWMLTRGHAGDGTPAARDLGFRYTPFAEAIDFLRHEAKPKRRRSMRATRI